MKPVVVTLEPSQEPITVSYEEAFGEYSEARGRGRARRKKRRLERIRNRQEVRKARREGRRERMRERQARRTERMQLRQDRKTQRKQARVSRRDIGREDEGAYAEEEQGGGAPSSDTGSEQYAPDTQQQQQQPTQSEPMGYNDQEVYPPEYSEEGDTQGDYTGNGEGEYETTQDSDIDSELGASDYESDYSGDEGFDGVKQMSPDDAYWDDYFESADGQNAINPKVLNAAKQIEKSKEAIKILNDKALNTQNLAKSSDDSDTKRKCALMLKTLRRQIEGIKLTLENLEKLLANYCKADGDYSEARGGRRAAAKRKAEVRAAKRAARKERKAFRKATRKAKRLEKKAARSEGRKMGRGRGVTMVEAELEPEISDNRIEIPADEPGYDGENFDGTGLIGIDDQYDYDSPETRVVDLKFSNADGVKGSGVNYKTLAIGLGLGLLAAYLYKKNK